MTTHSLRWLLLAFAGLVVAVAIAVLATRMVSARIGLSSEPLSAGKALSPRVPGSKESRGGAGSSTVGPTPTLTPATPAPPVAPSAPASASPERGDTHEQGGAGDD